MKRHTTGRAAAAVLIALTSALGPESAAHATPLGSTHCDFDNDGRDDLAIGIPGESIGGVPDMGAVLVLYGSGAGLTSAGDQWWHQNTSGIQGVGEAGDRFGEALACGDFDNDGFDDLAVGSPGEDVGSTADAGTVNVIRGSSSGLTSVGDQIWTQDSPGIQGTADSRDRFGASLASGDFDGDRADDLAVGAPSETVGSSARSAGSVNVIYGRPSGLTGAGDQWWHQDSTGVTGVAESRDLFGWSLAAGDFNGNGRDDPAIGVPGEAVGSLTGAGAVNVLHGGNSGLTASGDQFWHQNRPGVNGVNEAYDRFGATLAAGDFNGNGRDDLAVGVPGEDLGSLPDAGAVNVLYGAFAGLTSANDQLWHQNSPGVAGTAEAYDRMSGRLRSSGTYRIAFEDGSDVRVSGDHARHTPPDRIDMSGLNGNTIVAARGGTVRFVVDSNAEPTNQNNYVWISHPGGEWTKYTHFVQNSVVVSVGDVVSPGDELGVEGDVGQASGVHLHFEVAVPDDPINPITNDGFVVGYNLDPVVCGIPGQTFIAGQTYEADGC